MPARTSASKSHTPIEPHASGKKEHRGIHLSRRKKRDEASCHHLHCLMSIGRIQQDPCMGEALIPDGQENFKRYRET